MRIHHFLFFTLGVIFSSCGSYRQNIMFKADDNDYLKQEANAAETNYVIQRNDLLQLQVYTNQGEKIIDPNQEMSKETSQAKTADESIPSYLVDTKGLVKLPKLAELKLEGLTIRQAEEILQKEYTEFYRDPFVVLKFINKRVIVLGAPGGQVIPLTNENVRLAEVLAMAKGVSNDAKAKNIRILRGNTILKADFSTFESYRDNNYIVQPGDIVYVEPVRRPFTEALREYGPVISIVTSLGALVIVIVQLNNQNNQP